VSSAAALLGMIILFTPQNRVTKYKAIGVWKYILRRHTLSIFHEFSVFKYSQKYFLNEG
jgi:hypothetical protein